MRRIRLKKKYRLKVWGFLFVVFSLCFIVIPQSNRAFVASYFSMKCRNHQPVFSRKLTDRIPDYSAQARLTGIRACSDEKDLAKRVMTGQLVRVRKGSNYRVESMEHSYPYLTRDTRRLLNEIARRYGKKIGKDGLKGSRFIITSMTRTSENIKGLGKTNGNASENSPHLNGNAFDISYARFDIRKYKVTECDKWYMKEALAEVIFELRKEKKCWATYEKQQGCFHVVSRL